MRDTIRTIRDGATDGATNMARDEALMERVGAGLSPPTLRFYEWSPPTISLGYFQPYQEYLDLPSPEGELAVVRRLTGGGAILHDRELTYSLTLPREHPLLNGGPNRLYEIVHDAIIEMLASLGISSKRGGNANAIRAATAAECCHDQVVGVTSASSKPKSESSLSAAAGNPKSSSGPRHGPFFCFARRHCLDVLICGDKVAGSAQRRTRQAVLQHGSLILDRRYSQQPVAAVSDWLDISADELSTRLSAAFARRTGLVLHSDIWTDEELARADHLLAKYQSHEWNRRYHKVKHT